MAAKPTIPQGTRDFDALTVRRRKHILQTIEQVFIKYGYMPLETPSMEYLQTLTGKYGDEGDQLLFKILNSGDYFKKLKEFQDQAAGHDELDQTYLPSMNGKVSALDSKLTLPFIAEKGLRYDLTVPFARYVVMNRNEITFPFKRYQMQPVWRADRPQKGRYREFWQCDADVIGSKSLINEAELIKMYDEAFCYLNIPVSIRINNRKLLAALATKINAPDKFIPLTVALDKLDKTGESGLLIDLEKAGFNPTQTTLVLEFLSISKSESVLTVLKSFFADVPEGLTGVNELEEIFGYTNLLTTKNLVSIDVTLARGLTYYTGAIVEVVANAGSFKPSIGGGGRYDNLTGIFGLPDVSGVGISFGLDRIYDVMEDLNLFPINLRKKETQLLFCHFDEATRIHALSLCAKARNNNIAAEVYPDVTKKIAKQLEYADKNQIRYAVIIGSNEMESGNYVRKDLSNGTQVALSAEEIYTNI